MRSPAPQVPVLAYHSIADEHDHIWNELSLPVAIFERQLKYLHKAKFNTITLYELYEHLSSGTRLPPKPIALTFDDGYLDNWVHAFPLLEKYEAKATVFVATDFVDPIAEPRPNLSDVWAGRIAREQLSWWGYVSWPELRAMQDSGLIDVQSHTRTHTWYFVNSEIIDFHHPGDEYVWLYWNRFPEMKPRWLTQDFGKAVPWGTPVYEFDKTLTGRRYFDDSELARSLIDFVSDHGGRAFFVDPAWRDDLRRAAREFVATHSSGGTYETAAQFLARIHDELSGSKALIAERMEKPVDFLCWPGNTYSAELQRIAIEECGYLATVHTPQSPNKRGDNPAEVRRCYFGQEYQGPLRTELLLLNFYGTVNYQRGATLAFPLAPLSRRLMKVCNLFARHS
jgi:hypothetical protein